MKSALRTAASYGLWGLVVGVIGVGLALLVELKEGTPGDPGFRLLAGSLLAAGVWMLGGMEIGGALLKHPRWLGILIGGTTAGTLTGVLFGLTGLLLRGPGGPEEWIKAPLLGAMVGFSLSLKRVLWLLTR